MQSPAIRSVCSTLPRLAAALVVLAALLVPLAASAVPITLPTGLNPGDQYRLAFVTSTTRDATSLNIADYNAFVTGVANSVTELAALGTTWNAIGSTPTVAARDNTSTNPIANGTGVRIFLLNDTKLADSNADLWDSSIDTAFQVTETGAISGLSFVWAGSGEDGISAPGRELGRFDLVLRGRTDMTNTGWIASGSELFTLQRSLYAISGVITVVPEPGTAALLALGLIALGCARRTD